MHTREFKEEKVSFTHYKIDYSRCLGSGAFGCVYAVIPRPANEKGFFSTNFPYIYDYLFPASKTSSTDQYCVKIFHGQLSIAWKYLHYGWSDALERAEASVHQPAVEQKTNLVLRKYGISRIKFFQGSNSSQFKTRIKGKTLDYYLENRYFIQANQFALRKSFVSFLRSIQNPKLFFDDIHGGNIMYDEKNQFWEIIDGEAKEMESFNQRPKDCNITYFVDSLSPSFKTKKSKFLFKKLVTIANCSFEYTQALDMALIENMHNNAIDHSSSLRDQVVSMMLKEWDNEASFSMHQTRCKTKYST